MNLEKSKPESETYLDEHTLSTMTGTSRRTWQGHRYKGTGPRFVKLGSSVRYRMSDVESWLEENTRKSTSDQGERGDS